jgi:hypothetical protein
VGPTLLSLPVGPGRLFVNTALDAWRHRDVDAAAFDRDWRTRVAEAADAPLDPGAGAARETSSPFFPDERYLLRAWTSSRGGAAISERDLDALAGAVAAAVDPPAERRVIHPCGRRGGSCRLAWRSEWWLRRRRGGR